MTSILLIEQQSSVAAYLARGCAAQGIALDVAHDGAAGLRLLLEGRHDLALLDANLPAKDGWTILELANRGCNRTPVLFLTALGGVEQCVRALELGADDYIVKPFFFGELLARIRVILRRHERAAAPRHQALFALADLRVDMLNRRASRGADRLELAPKEFGVLSWLIQRAGEVQSRAVLSEQVWEMPAESAANIVEVAIRRLRVKLDGPHRAKLLHTVRGAGYVLEVRE